MNWKTAQIGAIATAIATFLAQVILSTHYAYSGPQSPEFATGQIYMVHVNKHVGFVTYSEHLALQILFWITVIAISVFVISRWQSKRG